MEWIEAHSDKIAPHFLPTYSPELNAAAYVWRETRRKSTHNRFFPTVDHLKQSLFTRCNGFQGNPAALKTVVASLA